MAKESVEQREGVYRISGTRVSLDSVVYDFLRGSSPESIAQSIPVLTLDEVYGAIAFCLRHQTEIDAYLQDGELEFEALCQQTRQSNRFCTGNSTKAVNTRPNRSPSGQVGDLILTNEAGMFFDIRHFHFWNSEKAGMFLKTKMVKRRKPEC